MHLTSFAEVYLAVDRVKQNVGSPSWAPINWFHSKGCKYVGHFTCKSQSIHLSLPKTWVSLVKSAEHVAHEGAGSVACFVHQMEDLEALVIHVLLLQLMNGVCKLLYVIPSSVMTFTLTIEDETYVCAMSVTYVDLWLKSPTGQPFFVGGLVKTACSTGPAHEVNIVRTMFKLILRIHKLEKIRDLPYWMLTNQQVAQHVDG